eukprot:6469139-Amphidinium_carterae.1
MFGITSDDLHSKHVHVQVLEFYSQKQRLVTRSVWTAELYALCDGLDQGHQLLVALQEVQCGVYQDASSVR